MCKIAARILGLLRALCAPGRKGQDVAPTPTPAKKPAGPVPAPPTWKNEPQRGRSAWNARQSPHVEIPQKLKRFEGIKGMDVVGQKNWNRAMDPAMQRAIFDPATGNLLHLILPSAAMWARIAADDAITGPDSFKGQVPRFSTTCGEDNCAVLEHTILDFPEFNPIPDSKYPVSVRGKVIGEGGCECTGCTTRRSMLMKEGEYGKKKLEHMLDCDDVKLIRNRKNETRMPQKARSWCSYAKIPYLSHRAAKLSFTLSDAPTPQYKGSYLCPDPLCGGIHTTRRKKK